MRLNFRRLVATCSVEMADELVSLVAVEPHLPCLAVHHLFSWYATALRQWTKLLVVLAVGEEDNQLIRLICTAGCNKMFPSNLFRNWGNRLPWSVESAQCDASCSRFFIYLEQVLRNRKEAFLLD